MNGVHACDFCGEPVASEDHNAVIYDCRDFISTAPISTGFKGAWLACATCASFIRQYDDGTDKKGRQNLARRSLEKYRRKYGLRGLREPDTSTILMHEITKLHSAFWDYRTDAEPVPYAIKQLEA